MIATQVRTNLSLLLILIACSTVIMVNAYFSPDGYLSPDSTRYLELAQSLLDGNGFEVSSASLSGEDKEFFAIWPIGYPVLIYLIAKFLGVTAFIASKLVNIIFIGLSLYLIKRLFAKDAVAVACLFLFSAYLELFSHSWSEVPFIFGMLWLYYAIIQYLDSFSLKISFYKKAGLLIQLLLVALFLFLMRYIGLFSLSVIGLLSLWQLKERKYLEFIQLNSVVLVGAGLISVYFYHNYTQTGWLTGKERLDSFESTSQLVLMVLKALLQESILLISQARADFVWKAMVQLLLIAGVFWFSRARINREIEVTHKTKINLNIDSSSSQLAVKRDPKQLFVLLAIGSLYYLAIISSRWISQFDYLNYRLMAPGSLFFLIALLMWTKQRASHHLYHQLRLIVFLLASLSLVFQAVGWLSGSSKTEAESYLQTVKTQLNLHRKLPDNAIIVFGNNHIRYLRPGMMIARPYYQPFAKHNESLSDFAERIRAHYPDKFIVIDTSQEKVDCHRLHPSWCNFLEQNRNNRFYQLQ